MDGSYENDLKDKLKFIIEYPRLKTLINIMEKCRFNTYIIGEPQCLFISGETGAGKTVACEKFTENHARMRGECGATVPVLYVKTPKPASVKGLATEVLDALGDPLAERGTTISITRRARKMVKECGVEVIIFDELQHFIDVDSDRVLLNVADWLKLFIEQTAISIILCGLPEAKKVLSGNPQLNRRFANHYELLPFSWGEEPEEQEEFRTLLYLIESKLPLAEQSNLADPDMASRIHYMSNGYIGYIMTFLRYAAIAAIDQGRNKLDLKIFSDMFIEHIKNAMPGKINPFESEYFDINVIPHTPVNTGKPATNRRSRGRKGKKEKATDLLKTD